MLVAATGILLNCNSINNSSDSTAIQNKDDINLIQLTWMTSWYAREGKEELIRSIARDYELLNQDTRVNVRFVEEVFKNGNYRDIATDSILKMIKTGKVTWDIIYMTATMYKNISDSLKDDHWGKKYLVNMADYDWFHENHQPFIYEDSTFSRYFGGIFPAPFIEGYFFNFWYNVDLAKKIGIDVKQTGMTFDDLIGYLEKAAEYNKTAPEKIILMYNSNAQKSYVASHLMNSFVFSALGDFENEKPDLNKGLAIYKRMLGALERISKYKPLDGFSYVNSDKVDLMLEGKVLFGSYGSYQLNIWRGNNKQNTYRLAPVELPILDKPMIFYPGGYQSVWAVFKNAPHKEQAIDLLRYCSSNDIAERWLSNVKNPTGLKSYINAAEFGQDEIERMNSTLSAKYGKHISQADIGELLFGKKNKKALVHPVQVLNGSKTADQQYQEVLKAIKR